MPILSCLAERQETLLSERFHLGGIATEKTSSAVHWYSAEFRGGTPSEVRTPSTQHAALCPALSRPPRLPVPSLYERL